MVFPFRSDGLTTTPAHLDGWPAAPNQSSLRSKRFHSGLGSPNFIRLPQNSQHHVGLVGRNHGGLVRRNHGGLVRRIYGGDSDKTGLQG